MSHPSREKAVQRAVLLVDMDAFFASVAIRERPELIDVPVIVGGRAGQRGAVASCNYVARQFGVRSAMSLTEAARRCPQATFLPVDRGAVSAASRAVRAILAEWSDVVEAASIDEFYLDMTGAGSLFGPLPESARAIQQQILRDQGLPCSVGGGTTKLIAKIAADRAKPGGIHVVPPGDEAAFLAPLPISVIPGVGPRSAESLRRHGLNTCGDVAALDRSTITRLIGAHGAELHERASGRDDRPVQPDRARKQMSQERTFLRDTADRALLYATLRTQAEELGVRLRREGLAAATVAIKLRWASWETITRQATLLQPTDLDDQIYESARALLNAALRERQEAVRLLGVAVAGLQPRQPSLWNEDERDRRLAAARDAIRARWGRDALRRAQTLPYTADPDDS